jgi:hypothetical protein
MDDDELSDVVDFYGAETFEDVGGLITDVERVIGEDNADSVFDELEESVYGVCNTIKNVVECYTDEEKQDASTVSSMCACLPPPWSWLVAYIGGCGGRRHGRSGRQKHGCRRKAGRR